MCDRFLYDKVETLRVIKDCIEGLPKSICECLSILMYSRSSSPAQNTASKLLSPIDRYAFCFTLSMLCCHWISLYCTGILLHAQYYRLYPLYDFDA